MYVSRNATLHRQDLGMQVVNDYHSSYSEGQTSVNKFDEKITIQQRALKELNQQLKVDT